MRRKSEWAWLRHLQVGDEVLVNPNPIMPGPPMVRRVREITPTKIIVEPWSFWLDKGIFTGTSDEYGFYLSQATSEAVEAARKGALRLELLLKIERAQWGQLSLAQLERVVAILDEPNR